MSDETKRNQSIDRRTRACLANRQAIALLAAGDLQGKESERLKSHFATCSGCRQYWQELIQVTGGLASSSLEPEIEPSPGFHNKLMRRLRQEPATAVRRRLPEALTSLLAWRWQTAAAAFAVIVIILWVVFVAVSPAHNDSTGSRKPYSYAGLTQSVKPQSDLSPTLASYEAAASQSLDHLDALLTRQANRPNAGLPVYRASPFAFSAGE